MHTCEDIEVVVAIVTVCLGSCHGLGLGLVSDVAVREDRKKTRAKIMIQVAV